MDSSNKISQKIFGEPGMLLIVSYRNGVANLAEAPAWIAEQGFPDYEILRTSEAKVAIRGHSIPRTCFPVAALSDDGKVAEILCSQAEVSYTRDPHAMPCGDTPTFAVFKKKGSEV